MLFTVYKNLFSSGWLERLLSIVIQLPILLFFIKELGRWSL